MIDEIANQPNQPNKGRSRAQREQSEGYYDKYQPSHTGEVDTGRQMEPASYVQHARRRQETSLWATGAADKGKGKDPQGKGKKGLGYTTTKGKGKDPHGKEPGKGKGKEKGKPQKGLGAKGYGKYAAAAATASQWHPAGATGISSLAFNDDGFLEPLLFFIFLFLIGVIVGVLATCLWYRCRRSPREIEAEVANSDALGNQRRTRPAETEAASEIYITKYGAVYHTLEDCPSIVVTKGRYKEYRACKKCSHKTIKDK